MNVSRRMSLVAIAALLAMGSAPALAAKAGQQNNFNRTKRVVTVPERAAPVREKPKPDELRGIERAKVKEALSRRGIEKAAQIKRKAGRVGS